MLYQGKFIVVEGPGGSGKGTQVALLEEALRRSGHTPEVIKFPRYRAGLIGAMANDYNRGKYGAAQDMPPQFSSLPYLIDRFKARAEITMLLEHGRTVIADRYWPTNAAYQSSKLAKEERPEFLRWLKELEFEELRVKREDVGIFLDISPEQTLELMDSRESLNAGEGRDVYESSVDVVRTILECYREALRGEPDWHTIRCLSNGQMRTREEIHADICTVLCL